MEFAAVGAENRASRAAMESPINHRMNGAEVFWDDSGGTETILQLGAAVLSEGGPALRAVTAVSFGGGVDQQAGPSQPP